MEARNLKDNLRIVSHLNMSRIINLLKLYVSYKLSNLTGKAIVWGFPFALDYEPTTACNLRCPECPSGLRNFTRPTGMLAYNNFQQTINQVNKHCFYLMFYFQGEPFLNPSFLDMVSYAKTHNLYVATSTNAHFIDTNKAEQIIASGIDRLIISIDGLGQDTYQKYRVGGDYKKVIAGTKNIVNAKKLSKRGPHIIWQFIVFRHNEHQIKEVKALGKRLGVDEVRIKSAQLYNPDEKADWMPKNKKYSRYANSKAKLPNQCWRLWHASVVTWDGKVLPCCYDKDAQHTMGHLSNFGFKDIWTGKFYRAFRTSIKENRSQHEICRNCGEGQKVWR